MGDKNGNIPYPGEFPKDTIKLSTQKVKVVSGPHIWDVKGTTESNLMTEVGKHIPHTHGVADLAYATELLEKVAGTDAGSVYRVVALGPKFNVAARLHPKNQTLSIRVAGNPENMLENKAAFHNTGFEEKTPVHTSMHLYGVDDLRASKCLGAAIAGCNGDFTVVCLDARKVKVKT